VHAILREATWGAETPELARLAALYRTIEAASEVEERDAVEAAAGAVGHPLVRRVAQAARRHRELPVTFPLGDRRVLEGVIDLAFLENGEWQVVDYKTDEDVEANRTEYERQLRWYMHALSTMTGMPARGTLLVV
jgi:ATP-dependent helicase/nuclease subunit A